jgi:hypothetical protein
VKIEFADSYDVVFDELCATIHVMGKLTQQDIVNGRLNAHLTRGFGPVWEPVTVSIDVNALSDRTEVCISFGEATERTVLHSTVKIANSFEAHLSRRSGLTRLE